MTTNKTSRKDLSKNISIKLGKSITEVDTICDAFLEEIVESLKRDEEVSFMGLFTVKRLVVPAKERYNPLKKEKIMSSEKIKAKFKLGSRLRDLTK